MSIVFIFALFGLIFGGAPGLMIGALLGFAVRWVLGTYLTGGLRQGQSGFLDVTFAVMGALSKADGVVTTAEIQTAQRIFDMLRLSPLQRDQAKAAFNRGKSPEFNLDREVDRLKPVMAFGRSPLLRLFLQLQCMAIAADGSIHEAEHAMLVRVARRLGLTEHDVAQLEALLRASAFAPGGAAGGGSAGGFGGGAAAAQSRLADAYTALGVSAAASDAEIKRAYRQQITENHPDKLASRGVPESLRQVAEERSREL
ncbi:MAG TPA: co-chaperone DjlA, partial [Gammaproteobacteria bacterium]|nr:co-chaperone DjlA [Gammaproteobacteria bacterium]